MCYVTNRLLGAPQRTHTSLHSGPVQTTPSIRKHTACSLHTHTDAVASQPHNIRATPCQQARTQHHIGSNQRHTNRSSSRPRRRTTHPTQHSAAQFTGSGPGRPALPPRRRPGSPLPHSHPPRPQIGPALLLPAHQHHPQHQRRADPPSPHLLPPS